MRQSDARVVQLKSWIERRQGKFEDFIESTRLARTLDPRNPKWNSVLARGLIMSHRYEEARLEIENSAFQDYDLLYLQGILQLSKHRDFGLWTETLAALQQEYIEIDDPYSMWEAHIWNRDYSGRRTSCECHGRVGHSFRKLYETHITKESDSDCHLLVYATKQSIGRSPERRSINPQ